MQTECTPKLLEFEAVERRSVVAGFDGGNITSNAGALLLGQVDRGLGLVRRVADPHKGEVIEVENDVRQQVLLVPLGDDAAGDYLGMHLAQVVEQRFVDNRAGVTGGRLQLTTRLQLLVFGQAAFVCRRGRDDAAGVRL